MEHTQGELQLVVLPEPVSDWMGAKYIIRQPKNAPGGVCIVMGGLGEEEELANARLFMVAPNGLRLAEKVVKYFGDSEIDELLDVDIELRNLARSIVALFRFGAE